MIKFKLALVVAFLLAITGCQAMDRYSMKDARIAKLADVETAYLNEVSAASLRTEEGVKELEFRRVKVETHNDRVEAIKLLMNYDYEPAVASSAVDLYIMQQYAKTRCD